MAPASQFHTAIPGDAAMLDIEVREGDRKRVNYLKPGDYGYKERFFNNLISKYTSFLTQPGFKPEDWPDELRCPPDFPELTPDHLDLDSIKPPRSSLITIKAHTAQETKVRAYRYTFRMRAPIRLQHLGFYAGFGGSNALGFGCGRVWYTERDLDTRPPGSLRRRLINHTVNTSNSNPHESQRLLPTRQPVT